MANARQLGEEVDTGWRVVLHAYRHTCIPAYLHTCIIIHNTCIYLHTCCIHYGAAAINEESSWASRHLCCIYKRLRARAGGRGARSCQPAEPAICGPVPRGLIKTGLPPLAPATATGRVIRSLPYVLHPRLTTHGGHGHSHSRTANRPRPSKILSGGSAQLCEWRWHSCLKAWRTAIKRAAVAAQQIEYDYSPVSSDGE